ncbi:sigma-70 family RNA polymerase sigma factor [Pseudotabrizicola algicola]|uniref:Sigma-70 family RNA polymerase sigma factor n=1 Tax=Pseudotabrizicola algicola TaxID=2709381 RepID=A0A6B3RZZ8_9RHOB|nr:sigma-70 family RNA polymerase sigma factor [Pseudotabrizicola algicola]NEX48659.1 sigma-70 family RNA polymerase sigma factor [Pseudotabrizicola algicola]
MNLPFVYAPALGAVSLTVPGDCAPRAASARLAHLAKEDPVPQEEPWEVLLARANEGDGPAFARFLLAVTPTLRAVIRRRGVGLPPDQHEDVLQEVLLAIHLKRQTWRRGSPVRPWLYAVARYKVVDAFRRRGAFVTLPIEDFAEVLPEEAAAAPLSDRDAETMLGLIDARSARLVRAVALDGKTAAEAGKAVGMTAGAARVALHRAMRQLTVLAERMMK